jgi:hypothetical protein
MAQTKKSGAFNLPLMILAFLMIAGFLYWLNIASEPTEFAVAEENVTDLGDYTGVSLVEFGDGPEAYMDQRIRIPNVRVTDIMGIHLFWFDLPVAEDASEPFLVRMDRQRIDDEIQVLGDDVVTLTGTVRAMSDSVITAWEELGIFTQEGQRAEAEAQTTFLDLDSVEIHGVDADDDPDGQDDDT